jgi:N-acetylglucosaminyl-diphospho-decaprenol L-rhamnosyltransferase
MRVHLLILNFNGRRLLAECLPSVVEAARRSRHECDVAVVDNASSDDSIAWLAQHHPDVEVIRRPNRGLCSYNDVVPGLPGRVAILLNNDIKLDPGCIDPLVEPLEPPSRCFMAAPLCWRFDGRSYEGFRTAIDWHWGLVRATALFPGHEPGIGTAGPTASAGAVMAVDRDKFAELGGFDPVYLPGRLEDLDLAYRAYLAGYPSVYVPEAVAYHRGMATFAEVYGPAGCDALALRNTLLFQWKNLRRARHVLRQLIGLPVRLAAEVVRAPWATRDRRFALAKGLAAALRRVGALRTDAFRPAHQPARDREFFHQFHPRRMRGAAPALRGGNGTQRQAETYAHLASRSAATT